MWWIPYVQGGVFAVLVWATIWLIRRKVPIEPTTVRVVERCGLPCPSSDGVCELGKHPHDTHYHTFYVGEAMHRHTWETPRE